MGSLFEMSDEFPASRDRPGVMLSSRDRLYPGPHYDAAVFPMDLPGAKVMVLSQSIQSHDLTYLPNGMWLLRCDSICHIFGTTHCVCVLEPGSELITFCGAYWPLSGLLGLNSLD